MPVQELRPTCSVSALTDKELEVLRLLAGGHTVKSIATRLERSEASINERLRDARRKTGVGSSRELARLLDAQKIWDRNIDLSSRDRIAASGGQPQAKGRQWSKGTIIMLVATPIAAAALAITATGSIDQPAPSQAAQAVTIGELPLVGTWVLDVDRVPAEERPVRVTIAFRVSPDRKWTTTVDMVGPDGAARHAESTAALDGVPVPIAGNMGFIDTVSLRQPAPHTLVMTLGKGGEPVSTRVYAVSRDQRSMTETIVWAGKGIPKLETTYFNRID
jgi:DNA-binding CsgD family transcriptional regulator